MRSSETRQKRESRPAFLRGKGPGSTAVRHASSGRSLVSEALEFQLWAEYGIKIVTSPPWTLRNITKAVLYRMVTEGARGLSHLTERNGWQRTIQGFAWLLSEGQALSPAGLIPPERLPATADVPSTLIFAPHPDDEVIIGGLPLRLLREQKLNVINVAVTLGSRPERQADRWQELKNCGGCLPRPTGTFCQARSIFSASLTSNGSSGEPELPSRCMATEPDDRAHRRPNRPQPSVERSSARDLVLHSSCWV